MINKNFFEDLAQQVSKLLPQAEAAGDDMKKSVSAALQAGFSRLDLLTHEEFESQLVALARAEERIDALEGQVQLLEHRVASLESSAITPTKLGAQKT